MATAGFLSKLSGWLFTVCLTPNNHKPNVMSVSLNKTFLLKVRVKRFMIDAGIQPCESH